MTSDTAVAEYPTQPCKSCSAPVIWATTTNGNPMPVDAEPSDDGNVRLEPRDGRTPLARMLTKAQLATTSYGATGLRKSHFAGCPQSDRWRKRTKARTS